MTAAEFLESLRRINGEWCGVALYGEVVALSVRVRDREGGRTTITGEGSTLEEAWRDAEGKLS